jgi:RNA polymerase sigma-70 factor (ECF subfamily)
VLDKLEEKRKSESLNEKTDEYLMIAFCDGDDQAFAEIVRRYKDRIVSYIYKYTRDLERSEEIAQEVFIRVFRSRDRYSVKAKFSTFIYRIAMNLSYNEVRDRKRRKTDATEDFPTLSREKDNPELRVTKDETERLVLQGINKLPPRYREVVMLCDLEDLSYKEAGKILNISVGTVQSRLSRGRIKLKQILTKIFDREEI